MVRTRIYLNCMFLNLKHQKSKNTDSEWKHITKSQKTLNTVIQTMHQSYFKYLNSIYHRI